LVQSAVSNRQEYLRRPDLGRRLGTESRAALAAAASRLPEFDLVVIASDGLSTLAVTSQCKPLLRELMPLARASGWSLGPLIVARHGRVALQDEIGAVLKAKVSLMLLGERPGLGSADSLGAYFTYEPRIGRNDAERNCVSNIREGGLRIVDAAARLHWLLGQALRLRLSGVGLKDERGALPGAGGMAVLD
jgi:ethanolamine ammonia-lyase small subunit